MPKNSHTVCGSVLGVDGISLKHDGIHRTEGMLKLTVPSDSQRKPRSTLYFYIV